MECYGSGKANTKHTKPPFGWFIHVYTIHFRENRGSLTLSLSLALAVRSMKDPELLLLAIRSYAKVRWVWKDEETLSICTESAMRRWISKTSLHLYDSWHIWHGCHGCQAFRFAPKDMQADKACISTKRRFFRMKSGVETISDSLSRLVSRLVAWNMSWIRLLRCTALAVMAFYFQSGVRDGRGPKEPRGVAMHRTPRCWLRGDVAVPNSERFILDLRWFVCGDSWQIILMLR